MKANRIKHILSYIGGKQRLAKHIIKYFPEHTCFVDVFGGAGNVLLQKPRSHIEVYNDIYSEVVNFFRVLRDPKLSKRFKKYISLIPYSYEEYHTFKKEYPNETDPVIRASKWLFCVTSTLHAMQTSNTFARTVQINTNKRAWAWANKVDSVDALTERLKGVVIENLDFREIIRIYDRETTLFYCDPPYVLSTRTREVYKNEMTDKDHEELVDILLKIKGKCIVSGFENDIYKRLVDNGWKTQYFDNVLASSNVNKNGKAKVMKDYIYISPNCQTETTKLFKT